MSREIGYIFEERVAQDLLQKGYEICNRNYTIRWWELDLVITKNNLMIFVEVKSAKIIDDRSYIITTDKKKTLRRTIQEYLYKNRWSWDICVWIACVQQQTIRYFDFEL